MLGNGRLRTVNARRRALGWRPGIEHRGMRQAGLQRSRLSQCAEHRPYASLPHVIDFLNLFSLSSSLLSSSSPSPKHPADSACTTSNPLAGDRLLSADSVWAPQRNQPDTLRWRSCPPCLRALTSLRRCRTFVSSPTPRRCLRRHHGTGAICVRPGLTGARSLRQPAVPVTVQPDVRLDCRWRGVLPPRCLW